MDLQAVPGLRVLDCGRVAISGGLLALERALDAMFVRLAKKWSALEYRFPDCISASALQRVDYFDSFPQLATFPVALDAGERNLETFVGGCQHGVSPIPFTKLAPTQHVLTPAACYHVYVELESQCLERTRFFTTRATCHRRETHFAPLRRQWFFSMREVVCVGALSDVREFLQLGTQAVTKMAEAVGIDARWEKATDPFFQPTRNPKHLFQKLEPVKSEIVYGEDLAIGSTNLHHDHFGNAFGIGCAGVPASSGCIAFGLERWLLALIDTFGVEPAKWPKLEDIDV